MSISTTDIKVYGSAVMPDLDATASVGGAIDLTKKVEFTDISPTGTVEMISALAADTTQTVTIYGRNAAGEEINEAKVLNGVSTVAFTTEFERISKTVIASAATGTVTVRKSGAGDTLITAEAGILEIRKPFYNATAPTTGNTDYYEKIFFKNTHATLSLTSAQIVESADPSTKITFGLDAALGSTTTITNRLTAPDGIVFDSTTKDVANSGNHTAGASQGVWLKLSVTSSDVPTKTTYTLQETGNTI